MDLTKFFDDSEKKWKYWAKPPQTSSESKSIKDGTIKEFAGHRDRVRSVGWNCHGDKMATGSSDKMVKLWKVTSTQAVSELKGHTDAVWKLAWNPTHPEQLASAAKDSTVRIWDTRLRKCAHKIDVGGSNINCSWSSQGNYVAVANMKDVVSVIDIRNSTKIMKNMKFKFMVHSMSWDKSEKYFLITTGNGTVDILSFPSMTPVHILEAHTGHCHCHDMDRGGKLLVTGGGDALVQLWDTSEMACLRSFERLESAVRSVSISHDSKYVASACFNDVPTASFDDGFQGNPESRIDISETKTGHSVRTEILNVDIVDVEWSPVKNLLLVGGLSLSSSSRNNGVVSLIGSSK